MNHPKILLTKKNSKKQLEQLLGPGGMKELSKDFFVSGKFIALKELLNNLNFQEEDEVSCLDNPNKILLFTRCTQTLQILQDFFKKLFPHITFLTLQHDQSNALRHSNVEKFNEEERFKLLLLTPKIGGLGLNLASANVVIMFDHDFNPMNDLQAMDRAHRLGQKKVVNVFRIVARDTLEEKIMGIQRFKLSVANTVVNYENATLDNVKQSNFVDFLEQFAEENQEVRKEEEEGELFQQLGKFAKYFKESDFQEWDDEEYKKEYV